VTGFVLSEGETALTSAPSCSSSYTAGDAAGSNPSVVCLGAAADNYDIAYVDGVVHVAKADQQITIAPDGMSCTDDNQCTSADMCLRGKCQGSPVLDGVLCTDGDPCTDPDTCRKGQCTSGGPISCDDGDRCTVDQCIEGDGCRHDPVPMCPDAGGGGDGGTPDADAGSPPDASPGDAGPDSAEVEVGGSGDAAEEGPPDAAPDLPVPDASPDEMGLDAPDDVLPDAGPDAADGEDPLDASDGGDAEDASTPDVVPVYQAQGGACLCSSSQGPSGAASELALVFGAALLAHRRRRGRP